MTDNRTTEKKSPVEAKGDCTTVKSEQVPPNYCEECGKRIDLRELRMSDETTLLPCPFCGGEPEIRERKVHHTDWFGKDYRLMYRVRCTKCGAAIGGYSPVLFHRDSNGIEHGAGVDWNTRTPEQAIAATLGNARAERGTLTADDIRGLIERHSDESGGNGRDFHNGAYVAIADERTCKFVNSKGSDYPPVCSACGYELGIYDCEWFEDGTYGYDGNYCPNCGCKVVGE